MNLLGKISLIVIFAGLLGVAIVSFFAFSMIKAPFSDLIGKEQIEITQNVLNDIDHLIHERYLDIRSVAEEENFQYFLASGDIDREDIFHRMDELTYLTGPWDALLVIDKTGQILLSSFAVPQVLSSRSIKDYPNNAQAFEKAVTGHSYYSDIVRMSYSNKPTIVFAAPVYYEFGSKKEVVGVVIGNLSHRVITEVLKELPGDAHLYNEDGFVIATNQDHQEEILEANINDHEYIDYKLSARAESTISASVDHGVQSFVSQAVQKGFLDYRGFGWHLVYEVESDRVLALASELAQKFTGLLMPVILSIFCVILIILSWLVLRPIRSLTTITREIKTGNLSKRSNYKSKDEIGELSQSFNEMIDQIEELDKTKTEFISLASHQLRTPVSTVNWYAETLLSGDLGHLDEVQKKYLEKIYKNNRRMGRLVNALLDTSRMELDTFNPSYQWTDLDKLIKSILDEYDLRVKTKKLLVLTDFAEETKNIYTEPTLLKTIIENLISNSIKYTKPGGKITIEISKDKDTFLVKISDTGYGIPEEEQSRIFTKLFRASNIKDLDTDGTGLGLYIVKAMVGRMGGRIWFVSKEHEGSIFYVSLPINNKKS